MPRKLSLSSRIGDPSTSLGMTGDLLVAEIFEVGCDFEIFTADKLNDALQFVLLFPSYPNLPVLQRALHFEAGLFDRLDYLFRLFAFQALLNLQFLPRVAQRRNIRFHLLNVTQVNAAFG